METLNWDTNVSIDLEEYVDETIPYAIVMKKEVMDSLTEEELIELTRSKRVDYIVTKTKEERLFLRYFKEDKDVTPGSLVDIRGNIFTSLGEGIYCYPYEDGQAVSPMKGRHSVILRGEVEYYTIIYDNDGYDKVERKEMLIPPGQEIYIDRVL